MLTAAILSAIAMTVAAAGDAAERPADDPARLGTVCDLPLPAPARLPPAGSPPIVLALSLCFDRQGGASLVDPQTYLYYIQVKPSEPSRNVWHAYTDATEAMVKSDFQRLWDTKFLDDLSVEALDFPLGNGVTGRVIVFHLEERQRVKVVDYEGLTRIERSRIDERLRDKALDIRLDSFVDRGVLKRVASAVRDLYAEKGYQFAEVTPEIKPIAASPKLVNVTFAVAEGPQVAIRDVEFVGNRQIKDEELTAAMKSNKAAGLLSFARGGGVYQTDRYAEDAEAVTGLYRERGYIAVKVGQPELRPLGDSRDGSRRWVQLRIPVTEGPQYRIGRITFEGNTRVTPEALTAVFKIKSGDIYNEQLVRKGLDKAREIYGAGGYYEFTAYPDLQPREAPASPGRPDARGEPPIVDVTLRVQEGAQYFVNRITFLGNTHTRDEVLRRELALLEAGVFSTESLKYSIRRLNQLGYFKTLDDKAVSVEKTPGRDDRVDVVLKVEEQNRNQVSFGAGASQYEGIFGNASFTTSNFLGRGESLTLSAQRGSRSSNYQVSVSEPYLFGRAITAGTSLFSRKLDYRLTSTDVDYSEVRTGITVTAGVPLRRFSRVYATYGYEVIDTAASAALESLLAANASSGALLLMDEGRHIQSSISPSIVHNTVDNPYAPRSGMRLTASYLYAGGWLGGTTNFARPDLEGILYLPVSRRSAIGLRAQGGWLWNYQRTQLPYYLRYFMGGETQIRGTNIRTVGPMDENDVPLGGSKFVLFNAEYYVDLFPQVRAMLFHDAGQAFAERDPIDLRRLRTSSGAELRVTLPMIGVPFRLIYAWNVYRDTFQPARTFKFAVGTTF
jgi:outer membrane protein insertion porin family